MSKLPKLKEHIAEVEQRLEEEILKGGPLANAYFRWIKHNPLQPTTKFVELWVLRERYLRTNSRNATLPKEGSI